MGHGDGASIPATAVVLDEEEVSAMLDGGWYCWCVGGCVEMYVESGFKITVQLTHMIAER